MLTCKALWKKEGLAEFQRANGRKRFLAGGLLRSKTSCHSRCLAILMVHAPRARRRLNHPPDRTRPRGGADVRGRAPAHLGDRRHFAGRNRADPPASAFANSRHDPGVGCRARRDPRGRPEGALGEGVEPRRGGCQVRPHRRAMRNRVGQCRSIGRAAYLMAEVLECYRRGQVESAMATVVQAWKAFHQYALDNNSWRLAWMMTMVPCPYERAEIGRKRIGDDNRRSCSTGSAGTN